MRIIDYNQYKNLEIVNIFEFYDKPLYYTAKSDTDDYYMFYFIDDDPGIASEWFVSQITENEIEKILHKQIGTIDLLNLFLNKHRLFRCIISNNVENNISLKLTEVNKFNLDLNEFPEENFFAEYDYHHDRELTYVPQKNNLIDKFKLVLKDAANSHNVTLDFLMKNLSYVAKSVNSIHNDNRKNGFGNSEKSEDPVGIDVLAFQPSSFGVWFEVKEKNGDLFNLGAKSVDTFFQVIETINKKSSKQLYEEVFIEEKYSLESLKIVNTYLKEIKDKDYSLSLEASSSFKSNNELDVRVTFNKDSYHNLQKIDSLLQDESTETIEEIKISGTLTSVNTKRNGFWLSVSGNPDINGTFDNELFKKIKNAGDYSIKVPSEIEAVIMKTTINNHLSDEYTVKYSLKEYIYL